MLKSHLIVLLCALGIAGTAWADLNTGLIGYYPFNGNANDESGNGNHGIVQGNAALTTDVLGNANSAYAFDGINSFIDINLPTINTVPDSKVTVSFWVNWNGTNQGLPFGFAGYDVWFSEGFFGFNTDRSDIWGVSSSGFADHWTFVTAIFNNGDITKSVLYVNGAKRALSQKLGSPIEKIVSTNARIGYYIGGCGACNFGGKIDDVRIYNRVLSAAEIQTLYYQVKPPLIQGTAPWAKPHTVTCQNTTQNKTVTIPSTKASAWNCEKAGLPAKSGDKIKVTIEGTKY